ncbi:CAP domain-containing protein [uncultured Flavobacterium sp.]|uniref:CAP domain-containing protein n=1 Tax=uncultured Flavobacterium sp. TaxID=165435 RepID=UPI0030EE03BE|tara:strand:- start:111 stop:605 length:495 start_codon:yes stop_codon:yes gene_type:complete
MNTNFLKIITVVATVLFTMASCSSPEEASIESVEVIQFYDYSEVEDETLDLINKYRDSVGFNKLEKINHISYISSGHTEVMVQTNIIGHANFAERQSNLHSALGALKVGENVAFNYSSPKSAIRAWIKSENHKANLDGDYTHFGISIRENEAGQKFYTNIFIKK